MITHGDASLRIDEVEHKAELPEGRWDFTTKGTFHEMGAVLRADSQTSGAKHYIVIEHEENCWIVWRVQPTQTVSANP